MSPFDEYVFAIVRELQDECVAKHRAPVSVSLHDITHRINEDVRKTLNQFIKDGKMTWYNNLNKIPHFTIKD